MMKCTYPEYDVEMCKNRFLKKKYICEKCSCWKESNIVKRLFKWLGGLIEGMNEDIHNG